MSSKTQGGLLIRPRQNYLICEQKLKILNAQGGGLLKNYLKTLILIICFKNVRCRGATEDFYC